jgi:hypothetical protein
MIKDFMHISTIGDVLLLYKKGSLIITGYIVLKLLFGNVSV